MLRIPGSTLTEYVAYLRSRNILPSRNSEYTKEEYCLPRQCSPLGLNFVWRRNSNRFEALPCFFSKKRKIFYVIDLQGFPLTLQGLYKSVRKRCGRAKVLAEVLVTIGSDEQGVLVPAKVVFVRDRNSRKWLALLSTDTTLTAEEIIKLYGLHWDIEVFFKMAKSFLNLAKEYQGRSFDAMVAHATLVCCRDIMLELVKRTNAVNADPRTLGNLFHAV